MIGGVRILLLVTAFAAAQLALPSIATGPAFAQKGSGQKGSSSMGNQKGTSSTVQTNSDGTKKTGVGSAVSDPNPKKKLEKPDSSAAKNRERACGNDQNKCYPQYQEMVAPHDARYQARLKAEKAYRDCMAKCVSSPGQRK